MLPINPTVDDSSSSSRTAICVGNMTTTITPALGIIFPRRFANYTNACTHTRTQPVAHRRQFCNCRLCWSSSFVIFLSNAIRMSFQRPSAGRLRQRRLMCVCVCVCWHSQLPKVVYAEKGVNCRYPVVEVEKEKPIVLKMNRDWKQSI